MTISLGGKVAIVTGAASGIGRASAIALSEAGCEVVLNDIDATGLAETASLLPRGSSSATVLGDVGDREQVVNLIERAEEEFGGLDILHANAGVELYELLEGTPERDIDRVLRTDLKGCLLCMQLSIPALRRRGGGSIIATASVQATHSMPRAVVYAAAKAGVVAAVRTLALEVGEEGIRVNAISPGIIETPMLFRDRERARSSAPSQSDDAFNERLNKTTTLRRTGAASEIGAVVVFLASDMASYITGTNVVVDGGFTAVKAI